MVKVKCVSQVDAGIGKLNWIGGGVGPSVCSLNIFISMENFSLQKYQKSSLHRQKLHKLQLECLSRKIISKLLLLSLID